jgi:hypothetical protein
MHTDAPSLTPYSELADKPDNGTRFSPKVLLISTISMVVIYSVLSFYQLTSALLLVFCLLGGMTFALNSIASMKNRPAWWRLILGAVLFVVGVVASVLAAKWLVSISKDVLFKYEWVFVNVILFSVTMAIYHYVWRINTDDAQMEISFSILLAAGFANAYFWYDIDGSGDLKDQATILNLLIFYTVINIKFILLNLKEFVFENIFTGKSIALFSMLLLLIAGGITVNNGMKSDCDIAQGYDEKIQRDLKQYQEELDELSSTYAALGFKHEIMMAVIGVVSTFGTKEGSEEYNDIINRIDRLTSNNTEETIEHCSSLLELKQQQVALHKKSLDKTLVELEAKVMEVIKKRG